MYIPHGIHDYGDMQQMNTRVGLGRWAPRYNTKSRLSPVKQSTMTKAHCNSCFFMRDNSESNK